MRLTEKIEVPQGINAELHGGLLSVKGAGKENKRHFKSTNVVLKKQDNVIEVYTKSERRNDLAETYTIISHIRNMIKGLQKEYECRLEVVFSHFPMNVTVKEGYVEINNIAGAKHPKKARIIGHSKVEVKGKDITVKGHNKEDVGQTAANMEQATKIKGKDIRIYQDGIYITKKVGVEE